MKVLVQTLKQEEYEKNDYRDFLRISINGKKVFQVCDGEPEDNTLARNFGDCFGIHDLLDRAHVAGLHHEGFTITHEKITWEEI